jgi:hypothetical protein
MRNLSLLVGLGIAGFLFTTSMAGAETRYIPKDDVKPAMEDFTKALGVKCDYCHLPKLKEGEAAPSPEVQIDTRARFRVARAMLAMTAYANKKGGDQATCNTCHNGKAQPGAK